MMLVDSWCDDDLRLVFPALSDDANKYSRGILTVVAGSAAYPGAACLAARAGQVTGAGYTEVVTAREAMGVVLGAYPSLVVHDVEHWRPAAMKKAGKGAKHAVCLGPGFPAGDRALERLALDVLRNVECAVLVDGGALAGLASREAQEALAWRRAQGLVTVLTPHEGEAARLRDGYGVRADGPVGLSAALACGTGAVMVVKGPDTYVSDGRKTICMTEGTPALAKAGTGDVLAGMIAALLAQGVDSVGAAVLGATLHARAGIEAARKLTPACVTPEDVIGAIPAVVRPFA